jgi:hypothetical protein
MTFTPNPKPPKGSSRPEQNPIDVAVRAARRTRRLPPDAACALCGETNPTTLTTRPRAHVLEQHHAAGIDNDHDLVVVLCLNHHAAITAEQLDAGALTPVPMTSALEKMQLALASLGIFFDYLAHALYRFATQIGQVVLSLDANAPGWRLFPGMP